jgi:nitrate reductase cytochrome c-type subunit
MKRKLTAILLVSTILLSGCSSTGINSNKASGNDSPGTQNTQTGDVSAQTEQRVQVQTNFNSIKPGTIPKLSDVQKAQVDVKVNSTLKDLDSTLKSIQDAKDIDYNSVN